MLALDFLLHSLCLFMGYFRNWVMLKRGNNWGVDLNLIRLLIYRHVRKGERKKSQVPKMLKREVREPSEAGFIEEDYSFLSEYL